MCIISIAVIIIVTEKITNWNIRQCCVIWNFSFWRLVFKAISFTGTDSQNVSNKRKGASPIQNRFIWALRYGGGCRRGVLSEEFWLDPVVFHCHTIGTWCVMNMLLILFVTKITTHFVTGGVAWQR